MFTILKKIGLSLGCLLLPLIAFMAEPTFALGVEIQNKADIQQKLDDYVTKTMKANHIKGAALAIAKNDEVFYAQGFGAQSDGRVINGSTPFPIASLSKSFTALAVLQLAEQGLIDLDAPYASYFPDLSAKDERVRHVTIRNLLNQTSGLNDNVNPDMTRSPQYQSLQEINQSLNTVKLAHDPGTAYSYHNPNYEYLALLVEHVSGQNFADYLASRVFKPLGMNQTYNVSSTQQFKDDSAIPQGHYLLFGRSIRQAEPSWFINGPAGIVSTAEDMAKWMLAQYSGRLLSPELLEQYHQAGQMSPYGMGWLAGNDEQEGRTISHSGIFWTYKSEETIYLDQQLGITMLFNSGLNAFVDYSAFIDGIASIMHGQDPGASNLNGRNLEIAMGFLTIVTLIWGIYRFIRLGTNKGSITTGKWILSTVGRIIPVAILLFLPSLAAWIGAGRVVPWFGLWTTMPSLIIWLAVVSLINIANVVRRFTIIRRV
ncbi:serine hydrolase domain-containing protein [Paenibacillus whitsoniae]|uniref:Class A beta-lactamase-related serine hydrolase n=1 Tax=Paenibacillus whitsoniae TaxID=2496558 RepID=A0A3S0AQD9_9BACL|nr:serine hydrolase domain-containing protein [Paenibacillus whitsoniae]RTE09996.1 class A beta-lactamase-related serine hydrolase [Paenibacillus whitsoniae]